MTTLTHTHRVTEVPDYCDCAALEGAEPVDHPWSLITAVIAFIGVVGCAVLVVAA